MPEITLKLNPRFSVGSLALWRMDDATCTLRAVRIVDVVLSGTCQKPTVSYVTQDKTQGMVAESHLLHLHELPEWEKACATILKAKVQPLLTVERCVVISTAHVSREVGAILDAVGKLRTVPLEVVVRELKERPAALQLSAAAVETLDILMLPAPFPDDGWLMRTVTGENLCFDGLDSLRDVYNWAVKLDVDTVRFDSAGDKVDGLRTYDW